MSISKSCFNCRNQNICVHKTKVFDRLENVLFITQDPSGLINIIAESIGVRCRFYMPYTQEEKEDREYLMSRKYYYGTEDQEIYEETNYEDAADSIFSGLDENDDFAIMVEMTNSRKSGHTFCIQNQKFLEYDSCGHYYCGEEYKPRNGIKGICKHYSFGLIETGRKWKVFADGTADGTIKKISGRNKRSKQK